jgi:hypothetical protein
MPKTGYGKEATTQKEDIFVASVQDPKHLKFLNLWISMVLYLHVKGI